MFEKFQDIFGHDFQMKPLFSLQDPNDTWSEAIDWSWLFDAVKNKHTFWEICLNQVVRQNSMIVKFSSSIVKMCELSNIEWAQAGIEEDHLQIKVLAKVCELVFIRW